MYRLIKPSDELYHYGVKGMKWGVRRYQNYDGTRIGTGGKPMINAGKQAGKRLAGGRNTIAGGQGGKAKGTARLAANVSKLNLASSVANASGNKDSKESEEKKSGMFDKSIKQGKGREDISPAEQINKSFKSGTESAKKATDTISKYDPKVKKAGDVAEKEAKKMSDKELRDKINRIKMEREYRSLAESEVESGWTKAGEVLEVVGDVASITLAVLGIVATIRSLKHDGLDYADSESELKSLLDLGNYDDDFIAHALDLDSEYIEDYLEHHGVKGMKWGVRRYQNYDGTRIGTGGGGGGSHSPKSSRKTVAGGGGPKLAAKTPGSSRAKTAGQGLKNAMREQKELGKAVKDAVTRPLDERRANADAAHKKAINAVKSGLDKAVKDGHVEASLGRSKNEAAENRKKYLDSVDSNYGSVKVKAKDDKNSYLISNGKYITATNEEIKATKKAVDEYLMKSVGLTSERQVEKYFKKNPDEYEDYKKVVNSMMEESINSIIADRGKETKTTRLKREAEERAQREQSKAIDSVYKELEKAHPNFNKLPQSTQDEMWFDYVNDHPDIEKKIFG